MKTFSVATQKGTLIFMAKVSRRLGNSIQSKVIAMAFSMAAEIERNLISQRTKEALAVRKKAGMVLGRPRGVGKSKPDQYRPEIEALLTNGSTQRFIAKRYQTSAGNLNRWIKRHYLQ